MVFIWSWIYHPKFFGSWQIVLTAVKSYINEFIITLFFWQSWIHEKSKLIKSTDELGTDLAGVIQLQRRLSGLERDLAAIQAKLDSLNSEADRISDEKPEEAESIRTKITQITELWQELKMMVRN